MLEAYRQHVEERAAEGVVPKPLNAEQVNELVELIKNPPAGEEEFIVDLLENRVPAGVDDAAYVKAAFLTALANGEATSPLIDANRATELLGTMLGGYNIESLISLLDNDAVAETAAAGLSKTLLMFDAFHDVVEKSKTNEHAKAVLQSWADAEWFNNKAEVPKEITVTVFMVEGETNTDDLSPAGDAWSRPDIPLHAKAMLIKRMENPLETIEELKKKATRSPMSVTWSVPDHRVSQPPTQCSGTWVTTFHSFRTSVMVVFVLAARSLPSSLTPWKMPAPCLSSVMSPR